MSADKYSGIIEAILFYETEVVSIERLNKMTGLSDENIRDIIDELNESYRADHHGIYIEEVADGFTFKIKKEIYPDIKQYYNLKGRQKLSPSLMTVLSIVAYKQPITKGEIEQIRGVSADNQIRYLLEKNFIEIKGRKEALGRPLLYGTTKEFLKYFNLKSIKDLPKINELKDDEFEVEDIGLNEDNINQPNEEQPELIENEQ